MLFFSVQVAGLSREFRPLSLMNIDTKTMTENISSKAGATGLGSDMSFLDVGSLDYLLEFNVSLSQ